MDTASEQDHAHGSTVEAIRSGDRISAPLAQGHHDRRVALHRLLHDRRGAEAAPDDLVESECVHVDNPEIDALTCAVIISCIALAIAVRNMLAASHFRLIFCGKLSRTPTVVPTPRLSFRIWKLARVEPARRVRATLDLS